MHWVLVNLMSLAKLPDVLDSQDSIGDTKSRPRMDLEGENINGGFGEQEEDSKMKDDKVKNKTDIFLRYKAVFFYNY